MLTSPLINEATDGVSKVVSLLDNYDLLREDFDSVIELTTWPGMKDPMSQIDSKVSRWIIGVNLLLSVKSLIGVNLLIGVSILIGVNHC